MRAALPPGLPPAQLAYKAYGLLGLSPLQEQVTTYYYLLLTTCYLVVISYHVLLATYYLLASPRSRSR